MLPKKYTQKGKIIIGIYLISLLTIVIISSSYLLGYEADESVKTIPAIIKSSETVDASIDIVNDIENDTPSDATNQNASDESTEQEVDEGTVVPESSENKNGTYSTEDLKILKEAHIRLYFDFQSFAVRDDVKASLDSFIDVIRAYPDESIVIEGHADGYPNFKNTAMEVELSLNRVNSIYAILTEKGLNPSQFVIINAGSSNPISVKKEERQKNDYVEIYFSDYVIKNTNGK